MRRISTATALAVLFSSVALFGAGTAAADSSRSLPITSSGDIVVDKVHQRIFISDPQSGKIVATDYTGTVVGTVPDLPGVTGLQLAPDYATLYAAVPGASAITAFDTASLTESGRYATGEGTTPRHLALAGQKLWFGYGSGSDGDLGSLDLSGAEPVVTLGQEGDVEFTRAPRLAATPGAPGTLATATDQSSLAVYDVAGDRAGLTARSQTTSTSSIDDLALTPDGTRLVTANRSGTQHRVWQTTDLSEQPAYATAYYPNAVAIAEDGTVAAGSESWSEPDIQIFQPGATTPLRNYMFSSTSGSENLGTAGLAWEPDGTRLFAVSNNGGTHTLRVLSAPRKSVTKITVNAPSTATRAKPLTVSGTVSASLPLPAGTPLTVTRTDMESPTGKSLGTKTLNADGTFSFSDTPPSGGTVTYKVSYAGSATHTPTYASDSVLVSRTATTLTLNNNKKVYAWGSEVKFTAHLGATYKNRTVSIYADPEGLYAPKRLVRTAVVNSEGNISATITLTRDTTVSATFAGDSRTLGRTASSWVGTRVRVATSLSGSYKTAKIGSLYYQYFKTTATPVHKTSMSAYEYRRYRITIQVYANGAWHYNDVDNDYFPVGTPGVQLVGFNEPGYRFRIRSSYIPGTSASGDSVNTITHSSWRYFTFVR
nr:WD40 repeat domain-containing protein [Wenjunlia vitaminophila]